MQQQTHDNVILELTVRNHPGVMTHVCGLFARRAFNVEGILCLPIQNSNQSHIWLLVNNDQRLEQMISQIDKLEDVEKVTRISPIRPCLIKSPSFSSELVARRIRRDDFYRPIPAVQGVVCRQGAIADQDIKGR
nr:acetolactate synthase small subunit [Raoultella sp. NCTC 9187]